MTKYAPIIRTLLSEFSNPHTKWIEVEHRPNFNLRRFSRLVFRYNWRVVLDGARLLVEHKGRFRQG